MCLSGAREVQNEVLAKIKSDKLKVFVIWTPVLPMDTRDKALDGMKLVADMRAAHFWDKAHHLSKEYGKTLQLPGGLTFAWDVYLVFDAKALWMKTAPEPADWMHQLGHDSRRLDADKLGKEVRRLLQETKR
jgi:hypothetical protein